MAISSEPLWAKTSLATFPKLTRDLYVDVAVIGAGITGITTARLLSDSGMTVALLDRRRIGQGDTSCTTAHVTAVTDAPLTSLASSFGRDHAQAAWDAGLAAIDQIARFIDADRIECDLSWVPGYKHAPFDAQGPALQRSVDALRAEARLAADCGFDVHDVASVPLMGRPGWRIGDQAVFDPLKYLRGLLAGLSRSEVTIAEQCEISLGDDPDIVYCGTQRVRAKHIVFATHNPHQGRMSAAAATLLQSKLALYTTYAVAARPAPGAELTPGCYWDTDSPYRYVRVDRDALGLRVIAGGEDHKTGQEASTPSCFDRLEAWLGRLLPGVTVTHRWSGQVIETHDGLPLIGEVAPRQFVATGFAGNGMTFGTLAGMMIRDAITGDRVNPWQDLFSPARSVIVHGPWNYLTENADYPYYLVRDRFAGPSHRHLRQIGRGDGGFIEHDGRTMAVYRNDRGEATVLSPICTHMGCRVSWNRAEHTWDCPCHGSRFRPTGEVLSGPAESALERVDMAPALTSASRTS